MGTLSMSNEVNNFEHTGFFSNVKLLIAKFQVP